MTFQRAAAGVSAAVGANEGAAGSRRRENKYLRTYVCVKDKAADKAAYEPRLRKIEVEPRNFAPPSQLSYGRLSRRPLFVCKRSYADV